MKIFLNAQLTWINKYNTIFLSTSILWGLCLKMEGTLFADKRKKIYIYIFFNKVFKQYVL
jgi:hypothetical protein